jgi:succinate dehydrogenase / fumarate reductase membrane anchor subunit
VTGGLTASRLTGLRAWWVQRVSAACLLLFVLFVLYSFARSTGSYAAWRSWVADPGVTLAFGVFFVALVGHMWVGLRDVLLDYARPAGVRNALLVAVALALLALAIWAVAILVRLHR